MRSIKQTTAFKQDLKREVKGVNRKAVKDDLPGVVGLLAGDAALPEVYRDHALAGNWQGYRECHVKPDLLLIYIKRGADILHLTRLGSHSELDM